MRSTTAFANEASARGLIRQQCTGDRFEIGLNTHATLQGLAQHPKPVRPPPIRTILRIQERERLLGVRDQGRAVVEERGELCPHLRIPLLLA
ncbi:hypothetical protein ACIOHS_04105 [Streptomyces sp. NPDC088253]|uniref:hypothetical protein n=1 Tax=Streptomyces sp. NPDC088253 TaxID=3365846 RepID=UPI0038031FB0